MCLVCRSTSLVWSKAGVAEDEAWLMAAMDRLLQWIDYCNDSNDSICVLVGSRISAEVMLFLPKRGNKHETKH